MTRILVLYGTTDGHTAKIARFLRTVLQTRGAAVDLVEAGREQRAPRMPEYDGVVVAASLHAGGYQRAVQEWVRTEALALNEKPTAFLSVSLGVLQNKPEVQVDLERKAAQFLKPTGWYPNMTRQVAGALPYSRYGWLKKWVMRRIVRKAGVETDPHQDYEYTDWKDLELFAKGFLWTVKLSRPESVPRSDDRIEPRRRVEPHGVGAG